MSDPNEAQSAQSAQAEPPSATEEPAQTVHPHGYKLADEEMARLEAKRAAGDVLDPIALDDPVGQSVERVVMRVGITVVAVLVVGILLAQIACKNIQLSGIPDFSTTAVTAQSVERALSKGITWGGDIVRFPDVVEASYDVETGTVRAVVSTESVRAMDQLASNSQGQAYALAMNLFYDPAVMQVEYVVRAPVADESGDGTGTATEADSLTDALTIVWMRADTADAFTCTVTGYDPQESSVENGLSDK